MWHHMHGGAGLFVAILVVLLVVAIFSSGRDASNGSR
jgi:hypothetical protein